MTFSFNSPAIRKVVWLALILSTSFTFMSFVSHANDENKMEGTYQGVDDDENFVFTKTDGTKVIFHAIDDAVEISLYDDDEIGKKFKIEWMAEEWDDYDDNDNVVGTITVKKITALTRM